MGRMLEGVWYADENTIPQTARNDDGSFKRAPSVIRHWVTPDGAPGPSGDGGFAAERGRYHLYVAINCPWAHRTWLMRTLKGLSEVVSMSTVAPRRTENGWVFGNAYEDSLYEKDYLWQVYAHTVENYTGRVTVPLLVDKASGRAVSNESAEIVRMFNGAFVSDEFGGEQTPDYYPADLAEQVDRWNERIYRDVNNGVYRAGFARTQEAYDAAYDSLFAALDEIESHLATSRYLCGDRLTEADWRLFPTLARFDVAYHYAFKCNRNRLSDFPNLWAYARELYQTPGIAETVNFEVYKRGYFSKSELRNPLGIVPKGPTVDWSAPHGRG